MSYTFPQASTTEVATELIRVLKLRGSMYKPSTFDSWWAVSLDLILAWAASDSDATEVSRRSAVMLDLVNY